MLDAKKGKKIKLAKLVEKYDLKQIKNRTFSEYEFDADAALRSKSKSKELSTEKLDYYKQNFVKLSRA